MTPPAIGRPASAALAVTTAADAKRPTAPAGLTAVPLGSTGFTLQWRPSTDNVGVTGYEVLRDGVVIGTTTNTSLVVTGLAPSAAYRFTVRARDAAGNWSSASAAVKVKTTAADLVPPAAPTQLVAGAITATGFTLSWSVAHDDVGVAGYEDSYAHQRGQMDRDGEPYGPVFGHLFAGFTPDRTDARPELADRMAERTYQQLRSFFDQTHAQKSCDDWANILPVVDHWARIEK